jgi:hypothetical protein
MMLRAAAGLVLVLGLAAACGQLATAQAGQEMLPDQSAAKAKAVLQQVITALGGQAYLDVRDTDCEGRIAQFGSNGELMGFAPFQEKWLLPDKNRTEYIAKGENNLFGFIIGVWDDLSIAHGGVLITVFNGDHGWMLDKGGVTDQPEDVAKNFSEAVKTGMNNMLRSRMKEDGVEYHYAGTDVIDLKEAEWIEFSDRDHRDLRLAVEKSTHLPLRWVVAKRDPDTRERTEIATNYAQYLPMDGVNTPLSLMRMQNGRQVAQTYLTSCKYNSNLSPDLFTRAYLEQHASQATKKGYKDAKEKK